jgi:glutamate-1-semialdehyde aminotransferase
MTVAPGGATERYGVQPDITCLAEALGGGLSTAAIGLRHRHVPRSEVRRKVLDALDMVQLDHLAVHLPADAPRVLRAGAGEEPGR